MPEVVVCVVCRLALPQPGDIGARARPGEGGKVGHSWVAFHLPFYVQWGPLKGCSGHCLLIRNVR